MKFCSQCGAVVNLRVPEGDTLPRHVCSTCLTIHYSNPKVVVGAIPRWEDKVLLCRRAIEPRMGLWTLPAGFLENSETTVEGAIRETFEEAEAQVHVVSLYTLFNLPHINQVYIMFLADLIKPEYGPGAESLEVMLCRESDVPWEQIAFPVMEQTLRLFFRDRQRGRFGTHIGDIVRLSNVTREYKVSLLMSD